MIDLIKDIKAVIPVREKSERIKEKVLLPFGGTTLYEWKIRQLLTILQPENIVVSTDSQHLISIAEKYGVSIHKRDSRYCIGNEVPFSEIVEHVVSGIDAK